MIKIYNATFYRNFLVVFGILAFLSLSVKGQTPPYFKGLGTATNTIPMNTAGSHTQQIYLPGDFNTPPASGLITKIYFRNSVAGATGTYTNFSVAFLQNSMTEFPNNTFLTGFTTALSAASITINGNPTAGGWYEIPLTTPFLYNNTQTLIVEIKYTARTGGMSGYTTTSTGLNKRLSIITPPGPATGNLSTLWGDFGMELGPSGPCTSPPDPGTVTSSANPVCLNVPFTLTRAGGTDGTGQTYQWQSSPDGIAWTNIGGATNNSYSISQTTSTYYRLQVTCGASTVPTPAIQVLTPAGVAGTFTINSALPTGGTNFQSFNAAYNYIRCGITGPVIFNVDPASGPYNEQLIMTEVPGASATNTVTFNGNGRTLTFNSTVSAQRGIIRLDGADHVRFNNLVISSPGTATTEYAFAVHLINGADSNIISNSTINLNTTSTSTNYAGIVVGSSTTSATTLGNSLSDFNQFIGNTITGGQIGIAIVGSTTSANQNNRVVRNTISEFYQYGVYLAGNFNTLVDSNLISRPTRATVTTFNGIYATSLNVSLNITRNTIRNPFGGATTSTSAMNGIMFSTVDALAGLTNVVSNNLLYNFTGNGIISALHSAGSDNTIFYHNTVHLDGTGSADARGFYQTTLAGGVEFFNNIVSITRTGTGDKYAIYYNTVTSEIASNYNDFYIAPTATNAYTGFYTANRATLADWQAASGDDTNSTATNPQYQSVATGNFRPTNASMDNLGTPKGILIDILGLPRSTTTPDMGAYEFTPGNCVSPPDAGTAQLSATPVCAGGSVGLSLTGHTTGLGQTYQWQSSTLIGGPYTNIGTPVTNPNITVTATTTLYYRAAVTCGTDTEFSVPVLLTVNPALPAGTYTIDKNAPATATNFISFNAAKDRMLCGISGPVVFNVVPGSGPYNEQLILDSIPGTSAVNTITFNGNGNTIAFSSSNTDERAVIKFNGADHITFDSLVIDATGAGTYGFGVHLINNADSNRILNSTVLANMTATTTNFAGIVMSASATSATGTGNTLSDGNIFDDNIIRGGYYGITMVGSTTAAVRDNSVTNNTIQDFYIYGTYLSGNFNALVEGNNYSRPIRANVSTFYGVYLTSLNVGVDVSKNRMHNPFGGELTATSAAYGVYFTGVDAVGGLENIVSNNLVYNFNGNGAHYGLYNAGSDNAHYFHNTISLQDNANTGTGVTHGFYQTTAASGIVFKNNLIAITRSGTGEKTAIVYNTTTSEIESNYNNLFVIPGTNSFIGSLGTVNYATLPAWVTASGDDANSIAVNPFFSSPATGNFIPMSPVLDNKGTPIPGITTDILNAPRSATTPDIGAYEFSVPPCTTPPAAGSAQANPNSGICMGASILLSLNGSSFGAGQTYQWQYSTTSTGPWTNLAPSMQFPDTTILATSTLYYRAAVTCGTSTTFSTPVLVTINPAFLAGTYTINSTIPASATNFTSFTTAVAALECGITGPVFFDVAPNTYTEQIRIHAVAGTSPTVRVTFRSANGDPASVNLTYDVATSVNKYVVQLDSASYITFRNMTFTAINDSGRVIELANTASFDSIVNSRIVTPASATTITTAVGIYADLLRGSDNVFKGNTITGGSAGIYIEGTAIANLTYRHVIDSNTISGAYVSNIHLGFNGRARVTRNTINVTAPRAATSYGIYGSNSDSAFLYKGNMVNINGTTTTVYGMYFTAGTASEAERGMVVNNKVIGLTGNTGTLYGIYHTASTFTSNINNVSSISTTATTSYALYNTGGSANHYYNNTALNSSPNGTTTNAAAYMTQTSGAGPTALNIRNNIFAHLGGSRAMYTTDVNFLYSNYNTFYTTGTTSLIQWDNVNYPTLQAWIDTSYWDVNSIVYRPALVSAADPRPNLTDPDVWAIHGRGEQIVGNDFDFNDSPRPTTLTAGVPDMGAYEFLPTSLPTLLLPTPATPAPGITQTFMYGTDTVARITYDANAPVPASINLRRYSGVLPTGLTAGQQAMYFYTDIDVPAQGAYKYTMHQYYIDPWRGFIPTEPQIKMGRTNAANAWIVSPTSRVNTDANVITDTAVVFFDKYTGLAGDPTIPPNVYTTVLDTSNRGTRFWVPYGHHYSFNSNGQDMRLYLSAEDSANVTVRVNGTGWSRTYAIPANTVRVSDIMPKYGLIDARITDEGLFERGISITSDIPIVAYAHIYEGAMSGATMLLPVGVYGYEYQSLNARQYYPAGGAGSYSWFAVISDRDSTLVEITPSVTTKGGRPANVPFTVLLMKGEVYNVMGTQTGANGTDISGSTIRSIANNNGNCYPIAVFSGSSRTAICNTTNGDNLIQQVFPSQAWGKRYLTFATAQSTSNTNYNSNIYRIMVKDPTTVVSYNGAVLPQASLVVPGNYYEVSTTTGTGLNGSVYVDADKPVMVAQYMISTGANSCPGLTATGNGDPEMIYISPIEQGIKKAVFYSTNQSAITANYINVVIPTAGLASLRIDGLSTFTHTFPHPHLAGYTAVRHNLGAAASQHVILSDSAFTAITYGLGSVESYGYNAGTLVKNLNAQPNITNTLGNGTVAEYTCVGSPFRFNILITAKPQVLQWNLSTVAGLAPGVDIIQNNPVPVDSVIINNRWFYEYTITTNYTFSTPGTYYVPILITDTMTIEGCDNTMEIILPVTVVAAPVADFSALTTGCLGNPVQFTGTAATYNNNPVNTWTWTFGDGSNGNGQSVSHTYPLPGTYDVNLSIVSADGCVGDTTKQVVINALPAIAVVDDSLIVCGNTAVTFEVQNPVTGTTYDWFTDATGGTPVFTGPSYTVPNVTGTVVFYVQATNAANCVSTRTRVQATLLPDLAVPVVVVDSLGTDRVVFRWDPVPGALTYEVSTNNGGTWITPSSGPTGLTHTVTGLMPLDEVSLMVRAKGSVSCQEETSLAVTARTLPDQIYIPNAFSPNGDGTNDILLVYGYTIQSMRMIIFNQWGEKIFETTNQATGWDGRHKGKGQPSGVYMYVAEITLKDGTKQVRKGSINLVR